MELELFWTEFAEHELQNIFNRYHKKVGYRIAKELVEGINAKPSKLKTQPEIGQIEGLLKDREQDFRYLIYKKNYKIIYWINREKKQVEIVDVSDVRQNPSEMERGK